MALTTHELHEFVLHTEAEIRQFEQLWTGINMAQSEWTMWLDLASLTPVPSAVSLEAVDASDPRLLALRTTVEKAYGISDPEMLQMLHDNYLNKQINLHAQWFVAVHQDLDVGEIGIVPFVLAGNKIGRLQDVDILPRFQGQGLGHQLLQATVNLAKQKKFSALCLMASADNWPKEWYQRFGFRKLGAT